MKPRTSIARSVACAAGLGGMILAHAASAQTNATPSNSQTTPAPNATPLCSSQIDIASLLPGGANEDPDVRAVNRFIDETFATALAQLPTASSLDLYHQIVLLGTLGLYDKNLSVNKKVPSRKWLEFEGGVISGLFNQPGPALERRGRSRHDDG